MTEAAIGIVGAGDQHRARTAPLIVMHGLDVFGAIHGRGAEQARGVAGAHQQVGFVAENVDRGGGGVELVHRGQSE